MLRRVWTAEADNDNGDPNALRFSFGSMGVTRSYGALALQTESAWREAVELCPIRFQGQWADAETGLYYNRFRHYDPLIGQYISPDPIGIAGGTRPLGYVHNPNGWVDPLGLAPKVPGRVKSRINLQEGDSDKGMQHVRQRHLSGKDNASQFSVNEPTLKQMLQSEHVVNTPISSTMSSYNKTTGQFDTLYVRDVNMGSHIGLDRYNNFSPTSRMTVITDGYGNLHTAFPGGLK